MDSDTSPETSPTVENFPHNEEEKSAIEENTILEKNIMQENITEVQPAEQEVSAMAEIITGAAGDDTASTEGETSFTEANTVSNESETFLIRAEQGLADTDDEACLGKDLDKTLDHDLEAEPSEEAPRKDPADKPPAADQDCTKRADRAAVADNAPQLQLRGGDPCPADDGEGEDTGTTNVPERSQPTTDVTLSQWMLHFG